MVKHFFFNIFGEEINFMKKSLFLLICCSLLFTSCGEDNDDFVLPEDVSNINKDIGITFGVMRSNCTTGCLSVFKWSESGVFLANNPLRATGVLEGFTFFECPISEEVRFVSRVDGIPNVPRALRDVPSSDLNTTINEQGQFFSSIYIIEYTLNSGITKTIQFFGGSNSNAQLSDYYTYVISTIDALISLDTTPITCQ